jgi:hypothetical protein
MWLGLKEHGSSKAYLDRARPHARQWLTIAAPFAGATAGLIATDKKAMTLLPNTPDQIRRCGRVSDLGALYSLGGFSAGILVTGKMAKKIGFSRLAGDRQRRLSIL